MSAPPRVTVILSTYNWSTVLPFSIGSVLRQTFTDFELLVVGDACTDDSAEVVAAIPDSRVRWINLEKNHGHQTGPNNEGLRQARGSIIAYLGHDDLWLPQHLEVLVAAIDAGADVAHTLVHLIGADGTVLRPNRGMLRYRPGLSVPPSGVVHRKSLTDDAGGWRDHRVTSTDPETELWHRLVKAGYVMRDVARLTVIKFPASSRKDVYKKRSNHEQREWTERIVREPDLEAAEMGRLLEMSEVELPTPLPSSGFRALLGDAERGSLRWRALFFLRNVLSGGRLPPPERGGAIAWFQKYKGVEKPTR